MNRTIDLVISGLRFIRSSIQLKFDTDGHTMLFQPGSGHAFDPEHILILTDIHAMLYNLRSIPEISLFESLKVPESFHTPQLYDGTQDLGGKRVLILMLNGWGDTILIQPALRAFHEKAISLGDPPMITLGCNWIHNFPYPNVPYIQDILPNILTLKDLGEFDILVNLIPLNHQRSLNRSIKDICFEILNLNGNSHSISPPIITPDPWKVTRIKPGIEKVREKTGKKLLCINWKSRFAHKDASPSLFFEIVEKLSEKYQAVLFKDRPVAKIMQEEIDVSDAPIENLSHLIEDYHDTVAALSLMDAFISVDTGIVHAAGALGIPGVALFGPFPPKTHVADYPSVIGIRSQYEGKICKGPCLETHRGCSEIGFNPEKVSPCFQLISPEDVIEALENTVDLPKVHNLPSLFE